MNRKVIISMAIIFGGMGLLTALPSHAVLLVNPPVLCSSTGFIDENVGTANFTFKLDGTGISDVHIDYAVTGGSAVNNGVDYTLANGTVVIPSGTESVDVPVVLSQNTLWTKDLRTIELTMSNVVNGFLLVPNEAAKKQGIDFTKCKMYIKDDSDRPTVSFITPTASGSESVASVSAKVVLSNPASSPVSIGYTNTTGGTGAALYDHDFVDDRGYSLTFPAGTVEASIPLTIINDSLIEGPEFVRYTITSPDWGGGAFLRNANFTYTILDDDPSRIITSNLTTDGKAFLLSDEHIFVTPGPTGYSGAWWAKRIVFPNATPTTTYVMVPKTAHSRGLISVYNRAGKLIQTVKPAGSFINRGAAADVVVQPSSTTPMLAFAHLNGSTVKFYEVTSTGLVARGQVVVNRKKFTGDLIIGYRKLYGTDYGLVTMVKGRTSTLQVWKYNPVKKTFSLDTAKATLAKLKVTSDKISLK